MTAVGSSPEQQQALQPQAAAMWEMAGLAAAALAVAPHQLGGVLIRAGAGPVRDAWTDAFRRLWASSAPLRRMPAAIDDDRLLGGLDLAATLAGGHPVAQRGLLAECHDGMLLVPMAERLTAGTAAHLGAALDRGISVAERDGMTLTSPAAFCVLALDESEADDPQVPLALQDRLAFRLDLHTLSHRDILPWSVRRDDVVAARLRLADIALDEEALTTLAGLAEAFGVSSLRALSQVALTARVMAALNGEARVGDTEISVAAALVLAPRATRLPTSAPAADNAPPSQADKTEDQPAPAGEQMPLDDVVLEATLAAIPAGLLAHLIAGAQTARARQSGKAGARQKEASRGRKIGTRRAALRAASRIDLIATLKAAAPWQMVRRRPDDAASQMVRVTHDDLRVARHRHRAGTTTIFVVDASGSSALQRLSEAKGAVRLMLAECYVRRDEVALIAFRGQGAETLLAPTRALTHAQRALAALPGGGGTPIAAGLVAAQQLAAQVAREGRTPMIVVMTDGKANVALDGAHGRPQAQDDARSAARRLATAGFATLLIDTSPQPQQLAADLAAAMQARYLAMPRADARRMAAAISAASALERSAA